MKHVLVGASLLALAALWPGAARAQSSTVTLTLYVHEGSPSGPTLSEVRVTGRDGGRQRFYFKTEEGGVVTITGAPGKWEFQAYKSGYETNTWSQDITATGTRHAFLIPKASRPSSPVPRSPGSDRDRDPVPEVDSLTPTLRWETVAGADYYALAISKEPYGSRNIVYNPEEVRGDSHQVPQGVLEPGRKYRWNMQAWNRAGWSMVSKTLYFQTRSESAHGEKPPVKDAEPVSGQRFTENDLVCVRGTGDLGLTIRRLPALSGEPLRVVPDGWILRVRDSKPQNADQHTWWRVREERYEPQPVEGWVAEEYVNKVSGAGLPPVSIPAYVTRAQAKLDSALEWAVLRQGEGHWKNKCLRFVAKAFGQDLAGFGHANEMKAQLGRQFYACAQAWNPPRGALVFFSGKGTWEGLDIKECGHVGLYLGGGSVVHAYGVVAPAQSIAGKDGICALRLIDSYLGWSFPPESWLSATVNNQDTSPSSGAAAGSVTLTLHVHEASANGPLLSGARITGRDAAGKRFYEKTDEKGYVTITGAPGTWEFLAYKPGYKANRWTQETTATCTRHAFLARD